MTEKQTLTLITLLTFLSPGLYGTLGAVGFYAFQVLKSGEDFSFYRVALYGFLGFVVGLIVHDFSMYVIGQSIPGLIIASGFSVEKIGSIAERFLKLTKVV